MRPLRHLKEVYHRAQDAFGPSRQQRLRGWLTLSF